MKKALIVCSDYPYPMDGGDKISTNAYILALRELNFEKIDLVAFDSSIKDGVVDKHGLIDNVFLMHKPPKISLKNMFDFLFCKKSFLFGRFYSDENCAYIEKIINDDYYDAVIVIQTYVGQLLRLNNSKGKTKYVLSTEVLHGRALQKRRDITTNYIAKALLNIESKRAGAKEMEIISRYDASYYYAKEDEESIVKQNKCLNTRFIDLALDLDKYPVFEKNKDAKKVLVFYGTCSWFPNEDALRYLLEKIWPIIKAETQNVVLKIAGKNMVKWAYDYADDRCEICGMVPDMSEFVRNSDIVLAPVRIGGGIRLKILEAMAWGRPIVSTRIGMEGNEGIDAVKIADTPREYYEKVIELLNDDSIWTDCVTKGREYVEQNHSIESLARKIEEDVFIEKE